MLFSNFQGAVKSCKSTGKVISDMSKELDKISETGTISELSAKMEEAESSKADVESTLLQRVSYYFLLVCCYF